MTSRLRFKVDRKRLSQLSAVLALGLVTGCVVPAPPADPNFRVYTGVPLPPSSVSDRVLSTAAQDLDLPRADLSLLRANEETWTDGCLGLGLPHEGCLQALVEGWQLEVIYDDQSWFYRTDATGDTIRQSYLENNLPPSLRDLVLSSAANDSGIAEGRLEIIRAEPRTWNGCLGIERPGEGCLQVMFFGWRVMVIGENRLLVYHTDMIGAQILLNAQESSL